MNRKQQLTNYLISFARLYGYVKYFHPSNEAYQLKWEPLASYAIKHILNIKNDDEYISYVRELFSKFTVGFNYSESKINLEQITDSLTPSKISEYKTSHWFHFGLSVSHNVYFNKRTNNMYNILKVSDYKHSRGVISFKNLDISSLAENLIVKLKIRGIPKKDEKIGFFLEHGKCNHYIEDSGITSKDDFHEIELTTKLDVSDEHTLFLVFLGNEYVEIESIAIGESSNKNKTLLESWNIPSKLEKLTYFGYNDNRIPNTKFSIKNYKKLNVLRIEEDKSTEKFTKGYCQNPIKNGLEFPDYISYKDFNEYNVVIPSVLYVKECQTYPELDLAKIMQLNRELEEVDIDDDTKLYNRLATIITYWNNLENFYPYWDYVEKDIDKSLISRTGLSEYRKSLLKDSLNEALKSKDLSDLNRIISKINSFIKDGHTGILNKAVNRKTPPIYVGLIEDKWLVKESKVSMVPKGSELIEIEGKNAKEQLDDIKEFHIKASLQHTNAMLFINLLRTIKKDRINFNFRYNHEMIEYTYDRNEDIKDCLKTNKEDNVKEFENGTIYLNINHGRLNDADIDSLLPKLIEANNIILDVRSYPGVSLSILQYIQMKPCPWSGKDIEITLKPHSLTKNSLPYFLGNMKEPKEPHISANIIALSSCHSMSYCESFLSYLKYNKLATIVGEPTAGTTGDVIIGNYPCKTSIVFTGMKVVNPDGSRFHGIGIKPDVEVRQTINGLRAGRDEVFEAALELCK